MFIQLIFSNDLEGYSLINHIHSNYVTSSQVSEIVNTSIESGEIQVSGSVIRKITRGTSSGNGDVTINCSITDTNKVIVLLDVDIHMDYDSNYGEQGGSGIYLKSVSTSKIVVNVYGSYTYSGWIDRSFSYQIVEFM